MKLTAQFSEKKVRNKDIIRNRTNKGWTWRIKCMRVEGRVHFCLENIV